MLIMLIMIMIIFGEILTHLKKKNIFLAQKLTELEYFSSMSQIFNSKSLKYRQKCLKLSHDYRECL